MKYVVFGIIRYNHVPMDKKICTSQFGSQFDFEFDFQNMKFPLNGEVPTDKKRSTFFVLFYLPVLQHPAKQFEHD